MYGKILSGQIQKKKSKVLFAQGVHSLSWIIRVSHNALESRDGISVKNSTNEYFSPKIAHKTRISRHVEIQAKTT